MPRLSCNISTSSGITLFSLWPLVPRSSTFFQHILVQICHRVRDRGNWQVTGQATHCTHLPSCLFHSGLQLATVALHTIRIQPSCHCSSFHVQCTASSNCVHLQSTLGAEYSWVSSRDQTCDTTPVHSIDRELKTGQNEMNSHSSITTSQWTITGWENSPLFDAESPPLPSGRGALLSSNSRGRCMSVYIRLALLVSQVAWLWSNWNDPRSPDMGKDAHSSWVTVSSLSPEWKGCGPGWTGWFCPCTAADVNWFPLAPSALPLTGEKEAEWRSKKNMTMIQFLICTLGFTTKTSAVSLRRLSLSWYTCMN